MIPRFWCWVTRQLIISLLDKGMLGKEEVWKKVERNYLFEQEIGNVGEKEDYRRIQNIYKIKENVF